LFQKKELYKLFFYFSVFLFLCEFDKGIKGADDGKPKIRQHELFGGLMMS
jgi:hypothetical protein